MWTLYERSINYVSETRSTLDQPPKVISTPRGSPQSPPLTTRQLPLEFAERLRDEANETYLWHGTDRASAESIIKEDFNIKRAGEAHAKALGRGAYFAESASLADHYATPGPDGLHALLLVRAALGKVFVTKRYTGWRGHKLVRLVSTTKLVRKGRFDSVLGDRNVAFNGLDIREYCVANSNQCYPEYMVLYSRHDRSAKLEGTVPVHGTCPPGRVPDS